MPRHGKKYLHSVEQVDRDLFYEADSALSILKKVSYARFDETVEVAVNLGVNPRHADQMVRGAVVFPHGLGKTVRVVVFAKGDKAKEAEAAGADFVGGEELVTRIKDEGWLDFDKAVATPDMMGLVGRIGRILGPRGLMPNPKVGTVTFDVARAVGEMKAGRVEFRVDKAGIVHAPIGKLSFEIDALKGNLSALIETLMRLKPSTAKGVYMQNVTLSSTMGPGLRLDVASLKAISKDS
ncbi:50S ribosomal protein L1 [Myxococcota bacterium]|nr:50S ribosomal protein L1 [Myxococcota bacterium]MBU1430981.1 50S ribosomal protein L1 [Myxococcota bacterium]MBU1897224.1 50S ribosomal protein L1 [Myxococcota bacterium]